MADLEVRGSHYISSHVLDQFCINAKNSPLQKKNVDIILKQNDKYQ